MGRIPRIGYLPSAGTSGSAQPTLQAVRQGLAELGYVDERDIIIEARWAEGRVERLPELAAELVALNVEIIVTLGGVLRFRVMMSWGLPEEASRLL